MSEQFSRTALIFGEGAIQKLAKKRVAIFGIGGVGGYVLETLVRSGIGYFDLIDGDIVVLSNLNRQIIATHETIGKDKVEVAKERALLINPNCQVTAHKTFFCPDNADTFDFSKYDYVVDAIDSVSAKLCLIEKAKEAKVPVISAMGAGNKICPEQFEISDIGKTSVCPLAKVIRKELKKRGIEHLKVVYSKEQPVKPQTNHIKPITASTPFTPPVMGCLLASEVVKDLLK